MSVALRPEIQFSPTGLTLPPDLSIEEWTDYGERLFAMERGVMWAIGDWWRYGNHRYGERAAAALDSRYAYQTFLDAAWVAGAVETSRRREVLSFSHHKEVAPLPPEEQDYWLTEAEQGNWTRQELRSHIRRGTTEEEPIAAVTDTWRAVSQMMDQLALLLGRGPTAIADAVPHRRRVATARRLRKLGGGLGQVAWRIEGMETTDDASDTAAEA